MICFDKGWKKLNHNIKCKTDNRPKKLNIKETCEIHTVRIDCALLWLKSERKRKAWYAFFVPLTSSRQMPVVWDIIMPIYWVNIPLLSITYFTTSQIYWGLETRLIIRHTICYDQFLPIENLCSFHARKSGRRFIWFTKLRRIFHFSRPPSFQTKKLDFVFSFGKKIKRDASFGHTRSVQSQVCYATQTMYLLNTNTCVHDCMHLNILI